MKLESLLFQLDQVRIKAENNEFQEFSLGYVNMVVMQLLIDFIGNQKVADKVDEIPF